MKPSDAKAAEIADVYKGGQLAGYLIRSSGLLVERFDRRIVGGSVQRLAQEDACQLLNKWPADKYRVSFNDIAKRLVEVVSSPEAAIMNLIEQIAFSWIIGNGDMHAKNYSVQWLQAERLVVPTPTG